MVVGYGNRVHEEVDEEACARREIPILRRCSGGGTVLQGPGCLNYSLVLRIEADHAYATISGANRAIMKRNATALCSVLGNEPGLDGLTDLTLGGKKFSGNAQRRRRHFLLFHGTFLLSFDLSMIAASLKMPSRHPPYRENRGHLDFLCNLEVSAAQIKEALANQWRAMTSNRMIGSQDIDSFVKTKYCTSEWNLKF